MIASLAPAAGQRIVGTQRQQQRCSRSVVQAVQTPARPSAATPQEKLQQAGGGVVQLYRYPGLTQSKAKTLLRKAQEKASSKITGIDGELCYNISTTAPLTAAEAETLSWLLRETFEPELLTGATEFPSVGANDAVVEVGPRMSFSTAWCANALSICSSCGLDKVDRIEVSRRFLLRGSAPLTAEEKEHFAALVHDRMTEQVYPKPLSSFATDMAPAPVATIPVVAEGRAALERINKEMGLAFDEWDLDYYTTMFRDELKRDPTNVELFDIAQSNSEHSRHWFFKADLFVDGQKMPENLMDIVKSTLDANAGNSVIGFKDNSSAIRGGPVTPVLPERPGGPSPLAPQARDWDVLLTAETHNFPCAVAPYPGAETGAGGRIRDTHATGIGSIMGAATAGYCTGNLHIDGYELPWEDKSFEYPASLAPPLQILIDASNGASDYGNKFGEPLVCGYTRTFGQRLPNGERREWIKPIMFSGGLGQIDHSHLYKNDPELGMLVVKIGGPAYRIGMGGGAASSVPSGSNSADLDFNAVQRGDAEVSQKLWRVVRACVELGEKNPIEQIHDQGAGGNCNVVKEIIYPLGAEIDVRAIRLGDKTMSVLEIWGAEYQENDCLLIKPEARPLLESICERERCIMTVIGAIDGSGRVVLRDREAPEGSPVPVDLDLEKVLGDMPNKTFRFDRKAEPTADLSLPAGTSAAEALDRVLRLPSVCSKRFLTTKVDRSVTGLIAQQQCCGPLQLPVSDVAVMAQTHFGYTGSATAIGEQPIKGLIDPKAMARLALGEALTNLVFARVTALRDVKASVNWMYAAKMDSEGAAMYDAAVALRDAMLELEVAVDGGKDSLSMAAAAANETVKAPGNLVVSAYVTCPDVTKVVTPDLKAPGSSRLLHVDLGAGRRRLGGSALAQAYMQVGEASPDVDPALLKAAFNATQQLVEQGKLLAGHDISDGGIVTTVLEMAFAGNCGVSVDLPAPASDPHGPMAALFAEELGLVLEHERCALTECLHLPPTRAPLPCLAHPPSGPTSLKHHPTCCLSTAPAGKVKVAIIREEGSNGDREMAAAVYAAGMEPWDVHMSDLLSGAVSLDAFQGIVFVGGFSYADVMDSAKGWAGTIRFNDRLWQQFQAFYARPDTFSLGVCNGCQLMALLGWVPATGAAEPAGHLADTEQPRFVHNSSGRFESRWSMVRIEEGSPAIMLQGMGGAQIGVWCAHGEGQAIFPSDEVRQRVMADTLAPIRYCDASGAATEQYPFNPNGSPEGIAALCSPDGRHLAMMPHPERCFLMWQNPWCAALGYDDVCWAAGGHPAVQLCRGLDAAQRQGAAPWGCGQLQ
ncbi:hypothetical protein COHA_007416 [Chlorella ohadii]|uniref:phosphoribosylformylglycinamidine synthase n=1 Tax=Chlorella ohadii TaxID=2649997 RepID=A0AAD5DMD3_9CHLO|nr:hypothetical protein COHA_007416 [Chlorella ohadii]